MASTEKQKAIEYLKFLSERIPKEIAAIDMHLTESPLIVYPMTEGDRERRIAFLRQQLETANKNLLQVSNKDLPEDEFIIGLYSKAEELRQQELTPEKWLSADIASIWRIAKVIPLPTHTTHGWKLVGRNIGFRVPRLSEQILHFEKPFTEDSLGCTESLLMRRSWGNTHIQYDNFAGVESVNGIRTGQRLKLTVGDNSLKGSAHMLEILSNESLIVEGAPLLLSYEQVDFFSTKIMELQEDLVSIIE